MLYWIDKLLNICMEAAQSNVLRQVSKLKLEILVQVITNLLEVLIPPLETLNNAIVQICLLSIKMEFIDLNFFTFNIAETNKLGTTSNNISI